MKKESLSRTTVIGAGKVGSAVSVNPDKDSIHQVNSLFWNTNGNDVLGTTALPLYGAFVSEENHHLFGDVAGKKLLEIGCGGGHSLLYHAERNASEQNRHPAYNAGCRFFITPHESDGHFPNAVSVHATPNFPSDRFFVSS